MRVSQFCDCTCALPSSSPVQDRRSVFVDLLNRLSTLQDPQPIDVCERRQSQFFRWYHLTSGLSPFSVNEVITGSNPVWYPSFYVPLA